METAVKSDQYWEQFAILPADLDYLVNLLLEEECPKTLDELVRALLEQRHAQQLALARESLSQGRIYRPGEAYEVGEALLFPNLGDVLGKVVAVRPGHNPEYEPFSVIRVQLEGGGVREYAVNLPLEHPLDTVSYLPAAHDDPQALYTRYGERIAALLRDALQKHRNFVTVGHKWFVRDLLMEISPVQLNIAEAMLDMLGGGPLTTDAIMPEIELPAEISPALQFFSLEYALLHDPRFDEVGPAGKALWYLRRMAPEQVQEIPAHLRYVPIPYNRGLLDAGMLSLECQLDDEWIEGKCLGDAPGDGALTVTLSYPHWRSGTLPLTERLAAFFPTARLAERVLITFVDGHSQREFPGWVVRNARYVYGLSAWYAEYNIGPGAYLDLRYGSDPGRIVVNARPFRSKRGEWLRTIAVERGGFSFEVTRYPVYCDFNEQMAIGVPDPRAVDVLAEDLKRTSLENLVNQVFQALAVLSLQRAVHAQTLYSVLNLLRRVPPAPMQAILVTGPQFVSLGDNYWSYRGEE